jgi:ABC-type Fe2+-enterobactin transport system substrate-binding protein
MKAIPGIAVASLLLAGLAGCTSTGTQSAYVAPTTVDGATATETRMRPDTQYIAEVEWIARQRGVRVQWVNPPEKRVTVASR